LGASARNRGKVANGVKAARVRKVRRFMPWKVAQTVRGGYQKRKQESGFGDCVSNNSY
jgi:hypothetical protein